MKRFLSSLAIFGCLAIAPVVSAQDLPDGEGKAVVLKVCGSCHGVDYVTGLKHTKAEWKAVVDTMIGYGGMATDQEIEQIVNYLTKNFGRDGQIQQAPGRVSTGRQIRPVSR